MGHCPRPEFRSSGSWLEMGRSGRGFDDVPFSWLRVLLRSRFQCPDAIRWIASGRQKSAPPPNSGSEERNIVQVRVLSALCRAKFGRSGKIRSFGRTSNFGMRALPGMCTLRSTPGAPRAPFARVLPAPCTGDPIRAIPAFGLDRAHIRSTPPEMRSSRARVGRIDHKSRRIKPMLGGRTANFGRFFLSAGALRRLQRPDGCFFVVAPRETRDVDDGGSGIWPETGRSGLGV